MRRGFFYLLLAALGAGILAVAWWVTQLELSPIGFTLNGQVRTLPMTAVLLGLVLLVGLSAVGTMLLFVLGRLPSTLEAWFITRRREQGVTALAQGMLAVAAGDANQALSLSQKAESLLSQDEQPMTLLLAAQARQLNGDEAAAANFFKTMTERPETAFLGYRGQIMQALKAGDEPKALRLARKARALNPAAPWVVDVLYHLEARDGHLLEAETATQEAANKRLLPPADTNARLATLKTQRALDALKAEELETALKLASEALNKEADFIPAVLAKARVLLAQGKNGQAQRLLRGAWPRAPHPDMAPLYAQAREAKTPEETQRAYESLAKTQAQHPLSLMLSSEAALGVRDYARARDLAKQAVEAGAGARASAMGSLSERGVQMRAAYAAALKAHEEQVAQAAESENLAVSEAPEAPDLSMEIERVLALPYEEAWICERCGTDLPLWSAQCSACRSVGTVYWRKPDFEVPSTQVELSGNRAFITRS